MGCSRRCKGQIKERYADDKMKQQQAMMALYKKEQINPLAGCLPIAIQIPVFFSPTRCCSSPSSAARAVLRLDIHDLVGGDPTNIFNLFASSRSIRRQAADRSFSEPRRLAGDHGRHHVGADEALARRRRTRTQQMIFNWMPIIFTFMLANFPAGLVIYWAWNNWLGAAAEHDHAQVRRQDLALG